MIEHSKNGNFSFDFKVTFTLSSLDIERIRDWKSSLNTAKAVMLLREVYFKSLSLREAKEIVDIVCSSEHQ